MPANDREVLDHLTDGDAELVVDSLTYTIFACQRREWARHYMDWNGEMPEQANIDDWISNLTGYDFSQMRTYAATVFNLAARAYMAPDVEAARGEGLRDALLREVRGAMDLQKSELGAAVATVKAAGSLWSQLGVALLTAIIALLIIGSPRSRAGLAISPRTCGECGAKLDRDHKAAR